MAVASASQDGANRMATGYFWSILAMMSAPFLLLGLIGGFLYYQIRKAQRDT